MDAGLLRLIIAFQATTSAALRTFLERAQLAHPFEWRAAGLPREGELPGAPAIAYAFHGSGLRLTIAGETVDFDFGYDGRTDGFNDWWLSEFAEDRPTEFPEYQDRDRLQAALSAARAAGEIVRPFRAQQDDLDYLAPSVVAQAS